MTKRRFDFRNIVLTTIFLCPIIHTVSNAQDFRGSLAGTVTDPSGARIPSAEIHLLATESSLERRTASDGGGEFRFSDLLPGSYRMTVTAPAFSEASSTVTVNVSSVRQVDVTLKPASAQQTLTVEGQASSIVAQPMDTGSAVHGGVVTAHDLASHSVGEPQLRQYRLPGAGNRAGRTIRSY